MPSTSSAQRRRGVPLQEASSISIKLSALEPRYSLLQHERVMQRLVPRGVGAGAARLRLGIQLTIDAEEADRLDLSLDVIEALAAIRPPGSGRALGSAVQAYGKRALEVIDWVAATARTYGRRMTVRLVKGAYWDSEIKRAQERGLDGLSGLHAQGDDGRVLSGLRRPPVQPHRCDLSAVRHA